MTNVTETFRKMNAQRQINILMLSQIMNIQEIITGIILLKLNRKEEDMMHKKHMTKLSTKI